MTTVRELIEILNQVAEPDDEVQIRAEEMDWATHLVVYKEGQTVVRIDLDG